MFRRIERQSRDKVAAIQEDRIPPFRPLRDFISDAAWNIPDFSNLERFNNRIINNLIYYQTNYLVLGTAVMLLIGFINLKDFLAGLGVLLTFLFACIFISSLSRGYGSTPFHRYPNNVKITFSIIYLVIVCGVIYMGVRYIYSLLLVILSILIAILAILIHAMLRKRNIANKVVNKFEKVKLVKTPMDRFLAAIGLEDL